MPDGQVILYIATSVDGFIATVDGGVSWLEAFEQDEGEEEVEQAERREHRDQGDDAGAGGYDEFFERVDCLVMGSTTYEQVLGFGDWPYGEKPTYVVTGRTLPLATDAVELVDSDPGDLLVDLEGRFDRIWLVGGAMLAQSALTSNRIDRLRVTVVPVLLGDGIRLFGRGWDGAALDHLGTTSDENGLVELCYDVDPFDSREAPDSSDGVTR